LAWVSCRGHAGPGDVILFKPLHPLHAILLAGTFPLFLGALCGDLAYAATHELQWKNFASWLIVAGLVFGGPTLAWAIIDFARFAADRAAARIGYVLVVLVMWVLGLINAFVHAGDAWASMPEGPVLSALVTLLAIVAMALGFANYRAPRMVV